MNLPVYIAWHPISALHDDVIQWKHFPRNWPFVREIHRSPVNSPHKGQWRGALMFSLICVWINDWVNNREAGDLRRYRAHSVIVMACLSMLKFMTADYLAPELRYAFTVQLISCETPVNFTSGIDIWLFCCSSTTVRCKYSLVNKFTVFSEALWQTGNGLSYTELESTYSLLITFLWYAFRPRCNTRQTFLSH